MKIISLIITLLLLAVQPSQAVVTVGFGRGGCSTLAVNLTGEDYVALLLNDSIARLYVGGTYSGETSYTFCQSAIRMKIGAGDVSGKIYYMAVYSMSGTSLDTKIGQSSNVSGSVLTSSSADVVFGWPNPVVLPTNYALVVTTDDAADASNYASISGNRDLSSDWTFDRWSSSKTRTTTATDANIKIWTQ